MCDSQTINNKINNLHKRYLRVIYSDKISSLKELLERDGPVLIHNMNLQTRASEMFKVYNNIAPAIFTEIFNKRESKLPATSHVALFNPPC